MTSTITFKPKLAIITAVVAAVTAILTYLGTNNPDLTAITGLAATGLTQGLSQYETETAGGATGTQAVTSAAVQVAASNWSAIQLQVAQEINALVKDPATNQIAQAVVTRIGQKVAELAAVNASPIAAAVSQSAPTPIPPAPAP